MKEFFENTTGTSGKNTASFGFSFAGRGVKGFISFPRSASGKNFEGKR